jgi:uncharacterized protein HemY
MEIDTKIIEKLLEEEKFEEAKKVIEEAFRQNLDDEEKGELLSKISLLYMEVTNSINRKYKKALEDALESIKNINSFESKVADEVKIQEVRGELNA